jgi:hypothetical protein
VKGDEQSQQRYNGKIIGAVGTCLLGTTLLDGMIETGSTLEREMVSDTTTIDEEGMTVVVKTDAVGAMIATVMKDDTVRMIDDRGVPDDEAEVAAAARVAGAVVAVVNTLDVVADAVVRPPPRAGEAVAVKAVVVEV